MIFERLVVLDDIAASNDTELRLSEFSRAPVAIPQKDPTTMAETQELITGADAAIVTWRTQITASVLNAAPSLRYVGLCASPFANPAACNIDLSVAGSRGIVVSALGQYGDEATAEWVMAQLLGAAHHLDLLRWHPQRVELFAKQLGIVGLGHVGTQVANRASAFGMRVVYSGRTPKPHAVAAGYRHVDLAELLQSSDAVSVHIGKGIRIFGPNEFSLLRPRTLLVNTSLGPVFDPDAFARWLDSGGGLAIADGCVDHELATIVESSPNGLFLDGTAADTFEMQQRKSDQLVNNVVAFLEGRPIRVVCLGTQSI